MSLERFSPQTRLSPMFRSMRPGGQSPSPLNGLLSSLNDTDSTGDAGMVAGPRAADYPMPSPGESMPPQMSQPARTQYARSTPPAQSPQNVFKSPSLRYPDSAIPLPDVGQSITAGLLDSQADTVAAGVNAAPMSMPFDERSVIAPPPPEVEMMTPQGEPLVLRPPDYLDPIQYVPNQSRRYEVI